VTAAQSTALAHPCRRANGFDGDDREGGVMILPDVDKVAAAGQMDVETVEKVYAAIAAVIGPEPVTPESERWTLPEPKASYPLRAKKPA
jgi:hypothetical protein